MEEPAELTANKRSSDAKLRRGLAMIMMTAFMPGSAQLAAGNKRVGRIAVRVWGTVVLAVLLFVLLLFLRRDWALFLVANGLFLSVMAVVGVALGVGWAALFVDAWRLASPREMTRKAGAAITVMAALLCFGLVGISASAASYLRSAGSFIDSVFSGGGNSAANDGRYNVLLIGGDAGNNRVGMRADSINVASIDAATGRTVLFGLPRNLERVPFPDSSPLQELYPDGYWCPNHECMLNAVYMLGEENKDRYLDTNYPGAKATSEAVQEIMGISINYFAMIDMQGFVQLIDAVGGITISTELKVPIGGGTSRVSGYIGPGKGLQLDGYHALWFARSREGASDYERMARQKCVMNAMVQQLDPLTVFTKFTQIADASKEVIATDVPSTEIGTLLELADKGRKLPIRTVSFTPPLIATGDPDFDLIRKTVKDSIGQSEANDSQRENSPASQAPPPPSSTAPRSSSSNEATSTARATAPSTGNTDDLNAICQVV